MIRTCTCSYSTISYYNFRVLWNMIGSCVRRMDQFQGMHNISYKTCSSDVINYVYVMQILYWSATQHFDC